jgi:glycerol-3-phosphate O-acyltransferase/dihydroxyacetone phosphate acyltransferase
MSNLVFDIIRKIFKMFFRLVLSVYFREITVIGMDKIPKEGPIIFVGNHANQYIDPMVICAFTPHHINFMVAASTYRTGITGFICKVFGSIPVERPQDIAIVGEGTLEFCEGGVVKGYGTTFVKQAMKGDTLKVKGYTDYVITEVLSDTEMKITSKEVDK